jgi:hypothetical protein
MRVADWVQSTAIQRHLPQRRQSVKKARGMRCSMRTSTHPRAIMV